MPPQAGTSHPDVAATKDRLGIFRRNKVKKGDEVVTDHFFDGRTVGDYRVYTVAGRSRDGQTVTIRPVSLTDEQKAISKQDPKAYDRKVSATSLYSPEATGLLRDRDAMLLMAETGNVPKGWKKSEESVIKAQDMDALARELFEGNPHLLRNRQPESGDPAQSAAVGRAKQAKHLYTPEKPRLFNKPVKASSVIKKMTSAAWRDESKYPVSDDELVTEFHNARILQAIKSQWKLFPDLSTDENRALAQFGGADYISKLAAMLEKRGLLKFADDSLVIDFDNLAKLGREKYPHRFQGERKDSRLPYLGFGLNPTPFYHPLWDLMGY